MELEQAKKIVAEALASFKGTLQDHNVIQTAFNTLIETKPEVQRESAPPTELPTSGDMET